MSEENTFTPWSKQSVFAGVNSLELGRNYKKVPENAKLRIKIHGVPNSNEIRGYVALNDADFARAVQCVNACGDVENPALLIEQAKQCVTAATDIMEENAALIQMLKNICKAFGELNHRPTFKSLNDDERRSIKLAREFLNQTNK